MKKFISFISCLIFPVLVGFISALITQNETTGNWFLSLQKPPFNPPAYLFAPIWTILYLLMGISLFLIWQLPQIPKKKIALIIFYIQLFLNFIWSILFFSCHSLIFSAINIICLWGLIIFMLKIFREIKPIAFYLQIPYFLWVSFATILNISFLMLNNFYT